MVAALTVAVAVAAGVGAIAPATDDVAVPAAAIAIDCTTAVLKSKIIDVSQEIKNFKI